MFRGDVVRMLRTPIDHIVTPAIPVVDLLSKSVGT